MMFIRALWTCFGPWCSEFWEGGMRAVVRRRGDAVMVKGMVRRTRLFGRTRPIC